MKDEISQLQSKYNSEVSNKEVLLFEKSFMLMHCLVFLSNLVNFSIYTKLKMILKPYCSSH